LAETYLAPEETPHQVAGSVVRLTLVHNAGAAMSLSLGRFSRGGFSMAALVALLVLARLYRATPQTDRRRAAALALIVGGAVGNLGNRLLLPRGVTDFIDIGVGSRRFWTFNVADAGITIGAVVLAWVLWREGSRRQGTS
jgi:signal peptidase II